MFEYLKGILADKYSTSVGFYLVVDVNGVGYRLEVSESDFSNVPDVKSEIILYAKLIHKEDTMALCGFLNKNTRDIFNYLISVSGVGTKMALSLLGHFDTCELISVVINEEYKKLTLAKGVGQKLAQKIILELKDRLIKADLSDVSGKIPVIENNEACKETTSILLSLGYTEEEINSAFSVVIPKCSNTSDSEELLRETLKILSM